MNELMLAIYLHDFYSSLSLFILMSSIASLLGFLYHIISVRYDYVNKVYGIKRIFTDKEIKVKKCLMIICAISFFTLCFIWTLFPSQHNLSLYVLYQIENNQNDLNESVKNYLNKWKEKKYANQY